MRDKKSGIEIAAASAKAPDSPWKLPADWKIEVTKQSGAESEFKAAVAIDGHLELIRSVTPFEKAFRASRVTGLFESTDGRNITVTVFSDACGIYTKHFGGSGTSTHKLIFDPIINVFMSGGYL